MEQLTSQRLDAVLPGGPDLERRFGGLSRLYGAPAYRRIRAARVAVVGVGGVGSWAVEALARSGVGELVLVDLDHVAESNINRQIQAIDATVGQAKVLALRERIAAIHPLCQVHAIEDFVEPGNWPALLDGRRIDALIDACDQVRAKQALAQWSLTQPQVVHVCVGAAGGKRQAHRVDVADLAEVTHDPLLASLRQRLRKQGSAPHQGRIGLSCVYSREPVARPDAACATDGSLNCHGYGSVVTVTATFGLVAAGEVLDRLASSTT